MHGLLKMADMASFLQTYLDTIAGYIGMVRADASLAEIASAHGMVKSDAVIHGDSCLANMMLDDWVLKGFIGERMRAQE